ncbi:MAG: PAS domain-containing sensor histidine kinase [Pseudomonadota bacterium]
MSTKHASLFNSLNHKSSVNAWSALQSWVLPSAFVVGLFLLAALITRHDYLQSFNALERDTKRTQQVINFRLQTNQDFLNSLGYLQYAKEHTQGLESDDLFQIRAQHFLTSNPELEAIIWYRPEAKTVIASLSPFWMNTSQSSLSINVPCRESQQEVFYGLANIKNEYFLYSCQKITIGQHQSMISAIYPINRLIRHVIPLWYLEKYTFDIRDENGKTLAYSGDDSGVDPRRDSSQRVEVNLPLKGVAHLRLSLHSWGEIAENSAQRVLLLGLILGLSGVILWGLRSIRILIKAKNLTEAAHASESMFRKAIESSVITGLLALDHKGTLIYANPSFCRMVGLHEDELKGTHPPFAFWSEADKGDYTERLEKCFERQTGIHLLDEMRLQHRHGSVFYARFYVSPLRDMNDQHVGWMVSVVDITEPHKTRQALTLAQERFIAVLDGLDAMVSVADPVSGELLYTNRAYQDFSNHPANKSMGKGVHTQLHELIHSHAAGATAFEPTEKRHRHAVVPVLPDCWLDVRERWIEWVDDRLVRLQIATDITVQRTVQHLMDEQQDRLEKNSRLIAMGEMASTLAHELNQPLTAITSYSKGCLRYLDKVHWQEDESEIKQDVLGAIQKVAQQAERAGRIVGRIRNFVKKTEPQKSNCELIPLIDEAVALAEIEFDKRGIQLIRDFHPPFPPVWLDPVLIEQLLFNLLKNAAEAVDMRHQVEPDATHLSVRLEVFRQAGNIQIGVHDHGIGLSKDAQDRLFSAFYTTKVGGMGMGLKICRSIVEFHQGRLWPESRPDGTTFWVTLPIYEQKAALATPEA